MISTSNAKILQLLLEALLPVVGYWFWDWNLYFILLFYFIDLIAGEVIVNLKSSKIVNAQVLDNSDWIKRAIISIILLLLGITVVHFGVYLFQSNINFITQLKAFWTYEDMGIQQGYILLPLVVFAAYQQYKMEFLMRAKEKNTDLNRLWYLRFISNGLILVFAALLCIPIYFDLLTEVALIHLIIVGITAFKFVESFKLN